MVCRFLLILSVAFLYAVLAKSCVDRINQDRYSPAISSESLRDIHRKNKQADTQ